MTAAPVTIVIDGHPVPKGRPRMTRRGIVFTPAATRKFEAHGRLAAQLAMDGRPPITGPVKLTALIELPVPTSWSGKRRAAAITGDISPTSRPDLDNYLKAAADALNGIVLADAARAFAPHAITQTSSANAPANTCCSCAGSWPTASRSRARTACSENDGGDLHEFCVTHRL